MISNVIYDDGVHKWVVIGRDPNKPNEVIDTNQYLIIHNNQTLMLDPGGTVIFPEVLTEVSKHVLSENIKGIVASHQDPDIASSLAMWLDLCPDVKVYCSWLWTGFIAHFGMGTTIVLNPIPDEGMELQIGTTSANVYLVPAHYCHSSGFFSCYDPKANILFSGDLGAALLPDSNFDLFVKDFSSHVKYMEGFHRRWMASSAALKQWVRRVREINPGMICPQHGSIFTGENVHKFLNWLEALDVGQWNRSQEEDDISKCVWLKWRK